jgi:hypothetical protein
MSDSNSGFTFTGSTSNSKGTVTLDGTTYNTCLKMGSSSSVTFTITEPMIMTLYFAASENKRISVTNLGELTIPASNVITATLPEAGTYTIVRTSGESYLYFIALSPINDITGIKDITTDSQQPPVTYNLAGQRVSPTHRGIIIQNGKKILRK